MSFARYSGGERDEDGEYHIPKAWTEEICEIMRYNRYEDTKSKGEENKPVVLPIEFTYSYYDDKARKSKTENERWEWIRLKNYSYAVLALLTESWRAFVAKYGVEKELVPDFIKTNDKDKISINKQTSDKLMEAETALGRTFFQSKHKIASKINKHEPLKRLKHFGAMAWLIFHIISDETGFVRAFANLRNFTEVYQKLDLNKEEDILSAHRYCKLVEKSISKSVRPEKITKEHGFAEIYEDENIYGIFNELCDIVGSLNIEDVNKKQQELVPKLKELYPTHGKMIDFYSDLQEIEHVTARLKQLIKREENSTFVQFSDYHYANGADLLEIATINYVNEYADLYASADNYPEKNSAEIKNYYGDLLAVVNTARQMQEDCYLDNKKYIR